MDWRTLSRHSISLNFTDVSPPDHVIELLPGHRLFIPPGWFHWIESTSPLGDCNLAINRWYDRSPDTSCLECIYAEYNDPPTAIIHADLPTSIHEMHKLKKPVLFPLLSPTPKIQISELCQNDTILPVSKSSTHQFGSKYVADVYPHLCQTVYMSLNQFTTKRDPSLYLLQCPIKGFNELFGLSGNIPYYMQNAWINYAQKFESLNHADGGCNILVQLQGTKVVRLWNPSHRDKLVMRLPISSKDLCFHAHSNPPEKETNNKPKE
jgi:hypothetical protein